MDPAPTPAPDTLDLAALERIERELNAVERALDQIDQGVYDGFEGLDEPRGAGPWPVVVAPDPASPS